ncbi:putative N6-adenine methyltransferase-domain-containing protein [Nemania sp. FL0916]|nr:putative N6-adenine methyltransferase-domain-containing protein [Nemania sp. FL0916]
MAEDTEEALTLSPSALAALGEFYAERDAQAEKLAKLKALVGTDIDGDDDHSTAREITDGEGRGAGGGTIGKGQEPTGPELSIHTFTEDWNESQFWYSDETANLLAAQLLDGTDDDSVIAVVSTPSAFVALKKILSAPGYSGPNPKTYLLEHDHRFAVFPEFVFYDFAQPFKLPANLKGSVDRMICDPPFLSEDCQTKMAMTLNWLARVRSRPNPSRVAICTGERMEDLVLRLYRSLGVKTTSYEPAHPGLKNEFCCYANFECEAWRWRQKDAEKGG